MYKILSLLFIFIAGCGAELLIAPIVTGVIKWSEGEAQKYYPIDEHTIYRATKRAILELECEITKDIVENDVYFLSFKSKSTNNSFDCKIQKIQNNITRLSIRVNFMGDKPLAELIYKKVDENLSIIEFENGKPARNRFN
jgi:predicted transport protein